MKEHGFFICLFALLLFFGGGGGLGFFCRLFSKLLHSQISVINMFEEQDS